MESGRRFSLFARKIISHFFVYQYLHFYSFILFLASHKHAACYIALACEQVVLALCADGEEVPGARDAAVSHLIHPNSLMSDVMFYQCQMLCCINSFMSDVMLYQCQMSDVMLYQCQMSCSINSLMSDVMLYQCQMSDVMFYQCQMSCCINSLMSDCILYLIHSS
jgi:hypothetical protein